MLLAGCICLAACQLEDQEEPAIEAYTKAFVKEFGLIDPEQDWNMATQGSVTVTTGAATNIKVYALIDGNYRLVADYADVTGTETITFDLPKGVEDIKVESPTYSFKAKVGDTVSFVGGTRGMVTSSSDTNVTVADADENNDLILSDDDARIYRGTLPEGKNNLGVEGVVKDFHLTDVTEMTIYPIYWQTSQTLTLGVYYLNDNSKTVCVPVYTIKDTDASTARLLVQPAATEAVTYGPVSFTYTKDGFQDDKGSKVNTTYENMLNGISQTSWQTGVLTDEEKTNITNILTQAFGTWTGTSYTFNLSITKSEDDESYQWTEDGETKYGGKFTYTYTKDAVAESNDWVVYEDSKSKSWSISDDFDGKIKSKGIKVAMDASLKFGLYITYTDSDGKKWTFYSQQANNSDGLCHAATYTTTTNGETVRYIGFEDWPQTETSDSDLDLNDLIVRVECIPTDSYTVVDEDDTTEDTQAGWIIACEDLGATDDFDFNDIVLHVSYVSTNVTSNNNVIIQALAAGGVLPAYVYFDGTQEKNLIGEIHDMLGEATPSSSGTYPMINTTNITNEGTTVVKNKSDFTIAYSDNIKSEDRIAKFRIYVGSNKEERAKTILKLSEEEAKGNAPQMLVVPDTWKWPKERTNIKDAYPKFVDWSRKNSTSEWYTDRAGATGNVVEK